MDKKKQFENQEIILNACAWCNKLVSEGVEVFGLGAKAKKGLIDKLILKNKEGKFITLNLSVSKKTVTTLVANSDSQAKRDGKDFMFLTCSHTCAELLKDALQKEVDMFGEVSMN